MSFNGNEGEFVTLSDASRWTANYRNTIQSGEVIALAAGKDKLIELLDQSECMGVRMYYAINDEGEKNLVIVGVDSNGDDMVDGLLLDRLIPCPKMCSKPNRLNN
ncbi:MAG: hypothetical protein RIS20_2009 [Bacteroidota bacterium]|jgi:hypothetical protein